MGITPRVLKHYEEKGILHPDRTGGNDYRAYSAEEIMKIQTAENLKRMGLSMNEIQLYFSGKIDLNALHGRLTVQRDMINSLLNLVEVEMQIGKPRFEIFEETTCLCYVKEYPLTSDIPQNISIRGTLIPVRSARDADATEPGISFAVRRAAFLSECESPRSGCARQDFAICSKRKIGNAIYRVCIPVLSAPESLHTSGTVKKVTRKNP